MPQSGHWGELRAWAGVGLLMGPLLAHVAFMAIVSFFPKTETP